MRPEGVAVRCRSCRQRVHSAAAEFTYHIRNLKRATIVGDTTGGRADPVDDHAFRMLPLGDDRFGLEELDAFCIQFVRGASGRVTELEGQYDNGMFLSSQRSTVP